MTVFNSLVLKQNCEYIAGAEKLTSSVMTMTQLTAQLMVTEVKFAVKGY